MVFVGIVGVSIFSVLAAPKVMVPVPAVAADLANLGANITEAGRFDTFTRGFLGTRPEQVTTEDQATFAGMLDRELLEVPR
jgi:hypothetical protein